MLLPEYIEKLDTILQYVNDIGGVDNISLREDHSFRFNIRDRNKVQDTLLKFDEKVKKHYNFTIDYGYALTDAMNGVDSTLMKSELKDLTPTQSPQVKVCVDPTGEIFSYMDAGFVERPGALRHSLGNVTNSSLEEQLKKMVKIKPLEGDITYLDAYNHLITKYISQNLAVENR